MPRPKENRVQKHFRVDAETPEKLNQLAVQLGFVYGKGGALGEMLDAIAQGELLVIPRESWQKLMKSKG